MSQNAKPWGNYVVLHKGPDFQVKRVEVHPSLRLSLQKHSQRSEQWTVVSGSGIATVGSKEVSVKRGSVIEIAIGQEHRMHNTGGETLVFIEIQFGAYLGEDDIIRLEDDFSRADSR